MKKSFVALAALLVFAAAGPALPLIRSEPPAPGSTIDSSRHDAPKTVRSTEITSFSLRLLQAHGYGRVENRIWVEDKELDARRPRGRYAFKAGREAKSARVTVEFSPFEDPPLRWEFEAPLSLLEELHAAIVEHKVPSLNGFSKRNTALGTFFDLSVTYASSEHLSAYGEGGISCAPPVGLDFFIDFFRSAIERYAPSNSPAWPAPRG